MNRCSVCNIKLKLLSDRYDCSCDPQKVFCVSHRIKEFHDCSTINKEKLRSELALRLPLVVGEKIRKI